MKDRTNLVLWLIYLSLLAVLLPHTAWAFGRFEPGGTSGQVVAWAAAFAFEAAIAVLTHKLARHIESVGSRKKRLFALRYLNAYSAGLVAAVLISAMANLAHAVEFGGQLRIFAEWGVPFGIYVVAFGGILPLVSLLFARVLSNVQETEHQEDAALVEAKTTIRDLRLALRQTEQRADQAEQRFGAAGDLMAVLFAEEKSQRILGVAHHWPQLPAASVAIISESSPSYVSEVLNQANGK